MIQSINFFLFVQMIFLSVLSFTGCKFGLYGILFKEDDVDERFTGIHEIEAPEISRQSVYSALAISDTHFGSNINEKKFLAFFEKLLKNPDEKLRPRFIICLGDVADAGHSHEYEKYESFVLKIKKIASECIGDENYKVYAVLGNHDLYHNGWDEWKKHVYPNKSSYRFTISSGTSSTKGFSYYFLDSANGTFGHDQMIAFEKESKSDENFKLIFTHYPLYGKGHQLLVIQDTTERNYMLSILAKNKTQIIFCGHTHENFTQDFKKFLQVNTAALFKNRCCTLFTVDESKSKATAKLLEY